MARTRSAWRGPNLLARPDNPNALSNCRSSITFHMWVSKMRGLSRDRGRKKSFASYIRLKLAAQQRPRHPVELVIPDGSVIDWLVQCSKMREFVHERLEAVVFSVATYQNSLVAPQESTTNRSSVYPLNYSLANQVDAPILRHLIAPYPQPGLPSEFSDFLASYCAIRVSHRVL
jgi:hypothetical protein